jgi:hypothetical protein
LGIVYGFFLYIISALVCRTKKNLATLRKRKTLFEAVAAPDEMLVPKKVGTPNQKPR